MDTQSDERAARPVAYRLRRRPGGRKSLGGPRGGPRGLPPKVPPPNRRRDTHQLLGTTSDFAVARLINESSSAPTNQTRSPLVTRAPRRVASVEADLYSPRHHLLAPRQPSLTSRKSMPMLATLGKDKSQEEVEGSMKNFEWKKKPRRRVNFEKAAFNQVEKPQLSEEEKQEIWYNEKELHKLRKSVKKMVRKGEKKLDTTQDCWRGLESYKKQLSYTEDEANGDDATATVNPDEVEECNKIILMLQKEKEIKLATTTGTCNSHTDLQVRAQDVLRKAMREGADQAAKDAAEAHAIYMETMDQEQVRSCFRSDSSSSLNCSPPRAA